MKLPRLATPAEEEFVASMRTLGWVALRSHRLACAMWFTFGVNVGMWLL